MQPWAGLPRPFMQPELAQEKKEGLIHGRIVQGLTAQRDKHTCLSGCQLLATIKVEDQLFFCRWMKWHKPTFSKFGLTDVKSVRTDVIDLECERLRDPQTAGRHQPKERVESKRPQRSCRRELLGFSENCSDLGRCEDVWYSARVRVIAKDPCRRKLMFGILSADVVCKQDKAAQTSRSLFQGRCTAGPCDRGVGLDVDLTSFSRETCKFLE